MFPKTRRITDALFVHARGSFCRAMAFCGCLPDAEGSALLSLLLVRRQCHPYPKVGPAVQKDPSLGCLLLAALIALSLVVLAGKSLAWLSVHVGYPVPWTTWGVFVTIALWVTFEVAGT